MAVGGDWGRGVEVRAGDGARDGVSSFTHRHLILHGSIVIDILEITD